MAIKSPVGVADHRRAAEPPEVVLESLITSHLRHRPANIRYLITGDILRPPIRRRRHLRIRHICILREDLS